jgi:nicotinate-nucleotide pyrophosphorylase (carboxylating)
MEYPQIRTLNPDYVKQKIQSFIDEDLPKGDFTSGGIFADKNSISTAYVQAEENIILAGAEFIPYFFGDNCKVEILKKDGTYIKDGEIFAKITGSTGLILSRERIMLNLIQRLCAIAAMAKRFSVIAEPYKVKILDTRKTTPGLRLFEKYAVCVGGGYNHRLDLSSGILIKDNHIKAAGSISDAVNLIKRKNYALPIEVEVENFEQITEALSAGADGLLLDNMSPATLIKAVELARNFAESRKIFIEASGGINLSNLGEYVKTGVDAISTGALTHSVKSANIHMEIE